jgi:hypothetical protein
MDMDTAKIREVLQTELAVPRAIAGRALAVGRYRLNAAIAAGTVPVTPTGTVPTSWLRQVLRIDANSAATDAPTA